jgi:hypothetical protein
LAAQGLAAQGFSTPAQGFAWTVLKAVGKEATLTVRAAVAIKAARYLIFIGKIVMSVSNGCMSGRDT